MSADDRFIDPVAMVEWLEGVGDAEELAAIECEFWAVAYGLPFERTSGELMGFGWRSREVAAMIAVIIADYRECDEPMLPGFEYLAEWFKTAARETEIHRLEALWERSGHE